MKEDEEFSMNAWRNYAEHRIEALTNTQEQQVRLKNILDVHDPELVMAWKNLANDAGKQIIGQKDGEALTLGWEQSLYAIALPLVFQPDVPDPAPFYEAHKAAKLLLNALNDIGTNLRGKDSSRINLQQAALGFLGGPPPLLPGKASGSEFDRNWLALILRERYIPVFFSRPHHGDIAALVNASTGRKGRQLNADNVRLLKSFNLSRP